jgi:hypothetical protein
LNAVVQNPEDRPIPVSTRVVAVGVLILLPLILPPIALILWVQEAYTHRRGPRPMPDGIADWRKVRVASRSIDAAVGGPDVEAMIGRFRALSDQEASRFRAPSHPAEALAAALQFEAGADVRGLPAVRSLVREQSSREEDGELTWHNAGRALDRAILAEVFREGLTAEGQSDLRSAWLDSISELETRGGGDPGRAQTQALS